MKNKRANDVSNAEFINYASPSVSPSNSNRNRKLLFGALSLLGIILIASFYVNVKKISFTASEIIRLSPTLTVKVVTPTSTLSILSPTNPMLTGTNTSINSWKMYENGEQNIRFNYPSDWILSNEGVFENTFIAVFLYKQNPVFEVNVLRNYNKQTGHAYRDLNEFLGEAVSTAITFTMHGEEAERVISKGVPGTVIPYDRVVQFTPDKQHIISLYYKKVYDMPDAENVMNHIVEGFAYLRSP